MIPFSVAGIQMHVSALHENLTVMEQRLDLLLMKLPWVQMVVFSELAAYGPLTTNAVNLETSDALKRFKAMAVKHGVWLIPGSLFTLKEGKIFNTTVVINPQGEVIGKYDKMFPFLPYEKGVEPGSNFLIFDVPDIGRFGVSICYDIWFPETTRTLTSMGVEVLLHPVLTGTVDRDIELTIAKSTAAMFQCYLVDVNGLGSGGNGRSCIVGPSGSVLYSSAGQEDQFALEIDLSQVRRQREIGVLGLGQTLKSFRDRKCEFPIYGGDSAIHGYLNTLGALDIPVRNSQEGLNKAAPAVEMPLSATEVPARTMEAARAVVIPVSPSSSATVKPIASASPIEKVLPPSESTPLD